MRRVLRWLWEDHGAPKLDTVVQKHPGIRPRNVTTNRNVIERLLETPDKALRLMILFCSDMAIRSGTAIRLGPNNYDAENRTLQFRTKMDEALTMPVTVAIRELIEKCNLDDPSPFVTQLFVYARKQQQGNLELQTFRRRFNDLRASITAKRITFHDLRRTSAVRMYEHTGDIRFVQALLGHRSMASTIWYLDHDLKPINRQTLEAIKQPREERKLA